MSAAPLVPDRCACAGRAYVVSLVCPQRRVQVYKAVCSECGIEGPVGVTERKAVVEWNKQAAGVTV
jgi:hypothetical protein